MEVDLTGELLILLLALAVGYFAGARMSRKRHYRECAIILEHRAALTALNCGQGQDLNDAAAAIREAVNG